MCLICERINMIKEGNNPYFVKELETGYVVLGDHQHFRGYTLFLCKEHRTELFHLDAETRLHWHLFPRKNGDLDGYGNQGRGPVWWYPREKMYDDQVRPTQAELAVMKEKLLTELNRLLEE